jgi:hypothetical protein
MQKKQTMHQIMLRDLKFLRYWWSCLTCSVTFGLFALHETFFCCHFVSIEIVNFLHLLRRLIFFLKKYVLRSSCWMQSALRMFTFYTIFKSCTATIRPPVKLRNYQSVAWVLYQRVIDQSKDDIFIKPGII